MTAQRPLPDDVATCVPDMKRDWDDRARRDAKWFINTLKAGQSEAEFDASGRRETDNLVRVLLDVIAQGRDPGTLSMLEIGCGIGRMTRSLAGISGEVYATDVSAEMIGRARARLGQVSNVHFAETNGLDFAAFPGDRFDFILSAYVYQHVPSAAAIGRNLEDAFRVLRPAGVFVFQTNGVANPQYVAAEKDTWCGDVFPEASVRALASRLGAQLLGLWGAGTQYCWTVWRKPLRQGPAADSDEQPRIVGHAAAEAPGDVPTMLPPGRNVSLLVSSLDVEAVDTNNLAVVVHGVSVVPHYVGRPRPRLAGGTRQAAPEARGPLTQVDFAVPAGVPGGTTNVSVRLASGAESEPYPLEVADAGPGLPRIVLITNAADGGLDVHQRGPRARVRVYLDRAVPDGVEAYVLFGDRRVAAGAAVFVPGNGCHLLELLLPAGVGPGEVAVRVEIAGVLSAAEPLHVERGRRWAVSILRRVGLAAAARLGRWSGLA